MPHTMDSSRSVAELIEHSNRLAVGVETNQADLPHLADHRLQLVGLLTEARGVISQQGTHQSAKQDLSRRLEELCDRMRKVNTFLRVGVKQHYGNRSEKLVEFDLVPFRSRTKPKPPPPSEMARPE